jgi:ketosteroid isomerase-like protein
VLGAERNGSGTEVDDAMRVSRLRDERDHKDSTRRHRVPGRPEGHAVSTGAPYVNRFISVITITDRKITRWRDYLDPIAVLDALGWPPRA